MRSLAMLAGVLMLVGACAVQQSATRPTGPAGVRQGMDHKSSFFVARKAVEDGYVLIFHVMPAPEGDGFSRTFYHLMVSVEKEGKPVPGLILYAGVKHPDGTRVDPAVMTQMGNWYVARFNLSHEQGRHWLTVSFERDEKSYMSGIYYPERPVADGVPS